MQFKEFYEANADCYIMLRWGYYDDYVEKFEDEIAEYEQLKRALKVAFVQYYTWREKLFRYYDETDMGDVKAFGTLRGLRRDVQNWKRSIMRFEKELCEFIERLTCQEEHEILSKLVWDEKQGDFKTQGGTNE